MFEESLEKAFLKRLFGPIEDASDAEYVTSGLGAMWVVLGALACLLVIRIGAVAAVSGILYVVLGLLLRLAQSRITAIVLLFIVGLNWVFLFAHVLGGGRLVHVLWPIVFLGAAVRGAQAAFAYHRWRLS